MMLFSTTAMLEIQRLTDEVAELKAIIDYIDDELTINEHHYHCNCASKLRTYLATLEKSDG